MDIRDSEDEETGMDKIMKYMKALAAIIVMVLLDQLTKYMAVRFLKPLPEGITLLPGVFRLLYLENRGSAFGLLQGQFVFFTVFTVIILIGIVFFFRRLQNHSRMFPLRVVLIMIAAGAVGNFIDRLSHHYVVDFLYFELIDFPIFNVADIYVTLSAGLLILLILFYYKEEDLQEIF